MSLGKKIESVFLKKFGLNDKVVNLKQVFMFDVVELGDDLEIESEFGSEVEDKVIFQ